MKYKKLFLLCFTLLIILLVMYSNIFVLSVQAVENTDTGLTVSATLPESVPSDLFTGKVSVSHLYLNTAVFNCDLPEALKYRSFTIAYEYWTKDDPDNIFKTNIVRTYTPENFVYCDAQAVFNIVPKSENFSGDYFLRAVLTFTDTGNKEVRYSDIVQFTSPGPPEILEDRLQISGYVNVDSYTPKNVDLKGFKVILNEGAAETETDKCGYFCFDLPVSSIVYYKLRINKPGFLEREIDVGYISGSYSLKLNFTRTKVLCGDINQDKCINMADIIEMAKSFNTIADDKNYIETVDLNKDNAVNMSDIFLAVKNFNKSDKDYVSLLKIPYIELKSSNEYIMPYNDYDKIIKFDLIAHDFENLSGYEVNINYDPKILQPVRSGTPYTENTVPESGDILVNNNFIPVELACNDLETGSLNFSRGYLDLDAYKKSDLTEGTGRLATLEFKVLDSSTSQCTFPELIRLSYSRLMPNGTSGTYLFDINGDPVTDYEVVQPKITFVSPIP